MSSDDEIESIISEEDAAVYNYASDEEYDPTAADREQDPPTPPKPKPVPAPAPAPAASLLAGRGAVSQVGVSKVPPAPTAVKAAPTNKSNVSTISADYSTTFDDDYEDEYEEEGSANYSADFDFEDAEGSPIGKRTGSPRDSRSKQSNPQANQAAAGKPPAGAGREAQLPTAPVAGQSIQLPSLSTQSLQAELAIDEISKEVIRLRNKQKALLKERQAMAKEKKLRAEQRRQQYLNTLNEHNKQLQQAEAETETLKSEQQLLQSQFNRVSSNRDTLEQQLLVEQQTNKELLQSIQELRAVIASRNNEVAALKTEVQHIKDLRTADTRELQSQVTRAELMVSVLQRSTEANEERLRRERDQLPEYHQHVLDEELRRINLLEVSIQERDGICKAEESRRMAAIDKMRSDVLAETERARSNLYAEIAVLR
jgi:hypothetical protein